MFSASVSISQPQTTVQVLQVVQRDLEERAVVPVVQRSDSFTEVTLKHVPIVCESEEEEEEGRGVLVNQEGHYERFEEVDLGEGEEEERGSEEEEESDLSLVLNDLPECERNHIVDVMCRELEMEIANHQKIRSGLLLLPAPTNHAPNVLFFSGVRPSLEISVMKHSN